MNRIDIYIRRIVAGVILAAIFLCPTSPLLAEEIDGDGHVAALLPFVVTEQPGRFGSKWSTELWFSNQAPEEATLAPRSVCAPEFPDCRDHYPPGFIGQPTITLEAAAGYLLYLNEEDSDQLFFNLRIFEHSRSSQAVGVEIPVVREDEFYESESVLLAIPTGSDIRSTLRVYDRSASRDHAVLVEFLDTKNVVVASHHLSLDQGKPFGRDVNFPLRPGFNWIGDITLDFPRLLGLERFNVRITPLSEGMSFWAFVSVTDNTSQHVLLVTPQ